MSGWTLVTGGSKRLGAEVCKTLAKEGHSIVVHYRSSEKEAQEVVEACRAYGSRAEMIQGDFSHPQGVDLFIQHYLEHFPNTVNLINNVGNYLIASAVNTTTDEWLSLFQVNLHAPFTLIRALLPSITAEHGSIINIGIAGLDVMRANTYRTVYTLTKNALWLLTKSLAAELAKDQVRVNMVSPGYLDNAIDLPDPEKIPMKRPATSKEIARVIAFLLEEQSNYITGQNIDVAGGLLL